MDCTPGLTVTVIICCRNRPLALERCIDALREQTYPAFKLLIVDSAPDDHRIRHVAERRRAGYVMEPRGGLSRARNQGARCCRTEIIAFLDDDCIPAPGWLAGLCEQFSDPSVVVVTGSIQYVPAAQLQQMPGRASSRDARLQRRIVLDRHTPQWFELTNFGGLGDGGNMALRRSVFDIWPGFDERLGRGASLDSGEEHHTFFSLLDLGYRAVYTPAAVIRHPEPTSANESRRLHLEHLRSTTAYITLLWFEWPQYRWALLRYVLRALVGYEPDWTQPGTQVAHRFVPRWRACLAAIAGPVLYARVRAHGYQEHVCDNLALPERLLTPSNAHQRLSLEKAQSG